MMKTALENNHLISDLKMILLINKTNRPFVFSDNPVVFYNKYLYSITHFGVLGMRTPGLKIFYPLSPDLCLLLIDKSKYNIKRIFNESIIKINNLKDVNSLNKLQIHSAQNCVYFHDHNLFDYISYLCRTEYTTLRKYENSYSETEVEKFDDGGAKDLIHTYAPQIPYFLELSFIKEIPIVGNGTPIDRSFYD
ncbi:Uncharacterised protein [Serratia fonticola]|uniref:Uncharacterized protein n=1 Tax=Serratia fonticola TaxID=47917 RepID=A0A3S4YL63_SERFO|nr:Uncharacterised protein [Serratia fonticola]